ncbi:hypothetical protein MPLB_630016 [Mesorhizobium sp. ORS 3324]|nr:hypothetical protein MPLB_630016 [Mesorhizobium sp. ORS 3324]
MALEQGSHARWQCPCVPPHRRKPCGMDVWKDARLSIPSAVHRRKEDPNAFVVYELYRDAGACDAHLASPPVKQALERFETLLSRRRGSFSVIWSPRRSRTA